MRCRSIVYDVFKLIHCLELCSKHMYAFNNRTFVFNYCLVLRSDVQCIIMKMVY